MKKSEFSKYIGELLTEMLIHPCEKKLSKAQSNLIDKQFSIALNITAKYGGQLGFRIIPKDQMNE